MKSFQRFVAMRYIRDRNAGTEGRGFVRFVTTVGIGGVAVGVASLILALSIVHGFSSQIERKIVGFGADIQVESQTDTPLTNASAIEEVVAAVHGVRRVRPVAQEFVLLRRSSEQIEGVVVNGVSTLPEFIESSIVSGAPNLGLADIDPGIVVGASLARAQGISAGDNVILISFRGANTSSDFQRPRIRQFRVTAVYETSLANFDATYVFADIEAARTLFNYAPDEVTRLDVDLSAGAVPDDVVADLESRLSFPIMSRTIREVYRSLFAWVKLQESIIPVVIGFIVFVAVFNIGGILLMLVIEKARSLGIMTSLGAGRRAIRDLVLILGLAIGVIGVVIGELLALCLALLQMKFELIPLPPDAYYISTAPIELDGMDFLLVGFVTVLLCLTFAYIPARVAASLDPIRVIRFR